MSYFQMKYYKFAEIKETAWFGETFQDLILHIVVLHHYYCCSLIPSQSLFSASFTYHQAAGQSTTSNHMFRY